METVESKNIVSLILHKFNITASKHVMPCSLVDASTRFGGSTTSVFKVEFHMNINWFSVHIFCKKCKRANPTVDTYSALHDSDYAPAALTLYPMESRIGPDTALPLSGMEHQWSYPWWFKYTLYAYFGKYTFKKEFESCNLKILI
jgi:hypothetical protein